MLSNIGTTMQAVGAAWLMLALTKDAELVSLVQTATSLPVLVLAALGGAMADAFDRRRIMLAMQVAMMGLAIMLAVGAARGWLTPTLLLVLTFAIGCCTAIFRPSWQASVGDIVAREQAPAAVTLNAMSFNVSRSIGPALGGMIVAAFGAAATFAANAASYLALIVTLWRWRPRLAEAPLPREGLFGSIATGLRYLAMSPPLIRTVTRTSLFGLGGSAILALLPVVADRMPSGGAFTYGILVALFGAGAVGAAVASGPIRRRLGSEPLARSGFFGFSLACILTGHATVWWILIPAMAGGGAIWLLLLSHFNGSVQLSCPRWVVGRTLSIFHSVQFGAIALGSWIWGALAERHGLEVAFLGAALCLLLGGLVGLRWPLAAEVAGNHDLFDVDAPQRPAGLGGQDGPLVLSVRYAIAEQDTGAFLDAMAERRRIRQRNGARRWRLVQDLRDPTTWTESYVFATWAAYVRHNLRTTHADKEITRSLHALQLGGAPPEVTIGLEHVTRPGAPPRARATDAP